MLVRSETMRLFFIIMTLFAENCIRLVDCDENKKIIIYVPRRVKTVHHHHHHVVLIDPKTETETPTAVPYSEKSSSSSSEDDEPGSLSQARQTSGRVLQHQFVHYHQHLRHQQQRRQLNQLPAYPPPPPAPFDRRLKFFPAGPLHLSRSRLPLALPKREIVARVLKYNDY